MTPKIQNAIALFCYASVSHMFATMLNPKMHGVNFTWENFPDMMERHCRTMVFTHVQFPKSKQKVCEAHAAQTGHEIAENLVKWMTEE